MENGDLNVLNEIQNNFHLEFQLHINNHAKDSSIILCLLIYVLPPQKDKLDLSEAPLLTWFDFNPGMDK